MLKRKNSITRLQENIKKLQTNKKQNSAKMCFMCVLYMTRFIINIIYIPYLSDTSLSHRMSTKNVRNRRQTFSGSASRKDPNQEPAVFVHITKKAVGSPTDHHCHTSRERNRLIRRTLRVRDDVCEFGNDESRDLTNSGGCLRLKFPAHARLRGAATWRVWQRQFRAHSYGVSFDPALLK